MDINDHRLDIELQRLDWARDLPEVVIQEVTSVAEAIEFQPGQLVIELNEKVEHVYFVISGRLAGTLFDRIGKAIRRDYFSRGAVAGLFSVLLPDRSLLQIEAVEPTTVVRLSLDELLRLAARFPQLQLAMLQITASIAKKLVMVDRELPRPAIVAVVHSRDQDNWLTAQLAQRLRTLGELPSVAADDRRSAAGEGIPFELIFENGAFIGGERIAQILKQWGAQGRLFIDIHADHSFDDLRRLVSYAEVVLWCVGATTTDDVAQKLRILEQSAPRLREKVGLVWMLNQDDPSPPYIPQLNELAARDFKIYAGRQKSDQGPLMRQGVERIVHFLRGVQIGIALGGGAARGMAHLGVLRSLERHGIFVDRIAGTSAGAMTGTVYAAGFDAAHAAQCFKTDLLPSRFFRALPAGGYWYLLYKYRRGKFEPMLRRYLGHLRAEQLAVPMTTIAVDLVNGDVVMRDSGDAVRNILESINLPPLSLPIIRHDQALVDGGLLNNVPANVLAAQGCNFVIASTVTAKLEKDFMGIRSQQARPSSKLFATVQVAMRQSLIQSYRMNAEGVRPADFIIAPDVTLFDMAEFTRADEMASVGEQATDSRIDKLKQMLSRLDPQLFG